MANALTTLSIAASVDGSDRKELTVKRFSFVIDTADTALAFTAAALGFTEIVSVSNGFDATGDKVYLGHVNAAGSAVGFRLAATDTADATLAEGSLTFSASGYGVG